METDVLVVGAGPTGLMLANWLVRLGVDCVVIDGKDGPTRESRALAVQARSMEIYDQLGMIDVVRDRAVSAPFVRPGFERRPASAGLAIGSIGRGLTPYPGLHTLEQSANEELLAAQLRRLAPDREVVRWGVRLSGLESDETSATARVEGGSAGDSDDIRARYVVGCDGAHSAVREALGVPFSGRTNPQTFWVLDAVGVRGLDDDAVNLRLGRDHFLIAFPMGAGSRHRLIGLSRRAEPTQESVIAGVAEGFGVQVDGANWFASYRLHHRVADRFRSGRAFLAGDAAHVHSPVGGQGMNTGLQDAHNLAFKLAAVLNHEADDSHLDHYEAERRPVALRLVRTTDRLFDAVTSPRPVAVRLRQLVAPALPALLPRLAPRLPIAGRMVGYLGQLRIHYWNSPAQRTRARGRRDPVVGRRLPWTGNNHEVLRQACWQVHIYAGAAGAVGAAGMADHQSWPGVVRAVHRFDPLPELGLADGTVLLVRPDGFVAARGQMSDTDLEDSFGRALHELGISGPGVIRPGTA